MDDKLEKILFKYKNNNYKHKCIKASMELLITLAENKLLATLVHANITMENRIAGHAWVEYGDIVIDLTLPEEDRIKKISEFYELAKVKRIVKYSFLDIQKLLIANGENPTTYTWVDWLILDE